MPGSTIIIAGAALIYKAAAGTNFVPGTYPSPPTGFTVLGSGLIAPEGIRMNRDWATTYQYVLAYAEPIAELLDTALTTFSMDLLSIEEEALSDVTGNAASASYLDLSMTPGPLPEYAIVLQYTNPGLDKKRALWLPRATIKLTGETTLRGGTVARTPIMVSALYDVTDSSAMRLYTDS